MRTKTFEHELRRTENRSGIEIYSRWVVDALLVRLGSVSNFDADQSRELEKSLSISARVA